MRDIDATLLLNEFLADAEAHLQRLRESGEPEVLTADGQAVAVVMSPEVFARLRRELEEAQERADIEIATREHAEGKARPVDEVFADIKKAILAKAKESA